MRRDSRRRSGRLASCLVPCVLVVAAAQAPSVSLQAPPVSDLLAVPGPETSSLEPAVATQLEEARQALELLAAGSAGTARLASAYGELGRLYHAYEFLSAAEIAYRNAARLAPAEHRWPHLLGHLYRQVGRLEEAADALRTAKRLRPDDHAAEAYLGDVYLLMNRLDAARTTFGALAAVLPATARSGLGEVALRERRYADAIEHFEEALAIVPQAASLHYSLAMAYRGLGRLDEARSQLARRGAGGVVPADPVVDGLRDLLRGERALVMAGRRAYEAGRYREAADAFARAADEVPSSVVARANLGLALAQLGERARAAAAFTSALALDGRDATARAGLGLLRAGEGRDAEAVTHLRVAFTEMPQDVHVGRELGLALIRLERNGEAIEVLRSTSAVAPDDEALTVGLAVLLAEEERYREAAVVLSEANARFPDRRATATTLARLLASSPDPGVRDGRRALDLATQVYNAGPAPAHAETVAMALAELGRCDEAAAWIERAVAAAAGDDDRSEEARLRDETRRYAARPCRP